MRKGSKLTDEQRRKISESMKGKTPKNIELLISKAHKFQKGMTTWNKNMKVDRTKFPTMGHFNKNTEETKKKISEATKKAMANPDVRKKLRDSHKGKRLSEEHKKKIGLGLRGHKISEETRQKISLANKGKSVSEETIKRLRLPHLGKPSARKGTRASSETLRKLSESHKGLPSARKGAHLSEEERRIVREATKLAMANPEIRRKISEAQTGEKSRFWKGGISFLPYSSDWTRALKKAIRKRDNYTCQICGKWEEKCSVHHIDYNKKNCNPENLIALCRSCHTKTNMDREKWKSFFKNLRPPNPN